MSISLIAMSERPALHFGVVVDHPHENYDLQYMVVGPNGPDLTAIVLHDESNTWDGTVERLVPGELVVISRVGWNVLDE